METPPQPMQIHILPLFPVESQQSIPQPQISSTEPESHPDTAAPAHSAELNRVQAAVVDAISCLGYTYNENSINPTSFSKCSTALQVTAPPGSSLPTVRSSPSKSWTMNYSVLSFLMNGQLYAEYSRISNMLGLPSCSHVQWRRIVQWTEEHVTKLAEWSCEQVREKVRRRGDSKSWTASYDGFYLTRGHYSNNSSATLHDYTTGEIAWFAHRTKRGAGHNWEGTSNGAEGDMFNEILGSVNNAGFNISDIVTDKDSSGNAIFCSHFPEGMITYCSNHSAKTMHKDLLKVKQAKCNVSNTIFVCSCLLTYNLVYLVSQKCPWCW